MKLRVFPKQRELHPENCEQNEREHDERIQDAETRANRLIETAEWIRNAVARRDEQNSWQRSVNRLFLGEGT